MKERKIKGKQDEEKKRSRIHEEEKEELRWGVDGR